MFVLNENPEIVMRTKAWIGDWYEYVVQLVNPNGTPVDITTGTLSATFINVATGAGYQFFPPPQIPPPGAATTLTKSFATEGIVTILNIESYPTPATIRIGIRLTNGAVVRVFGPLEVEILQA